MTAATKPTAWEQLREPFPPEQIGKLPKPTKKDNAKGRCDVCGGWHGLPAVHLDYVGHAATTDRLLQVDPEWTWEPMGCGTDGNPQMVQGVEGEPLGLWIKLTVAGVTRPGYGSGKSAKECISDAIRNAAMRFGVALDLWAKEDLHGNGDAPKAEKAKPKFEAPKAPKPDEEAAKLTTELLELVGQIGDSSGKRDELVPATEALVQQHAGDKEWLKRQIKTAKTQLETVAPLPF